MSVWTKVVNQPTDRLRHITIPRTLLLVWLKILIFIFSVKFSSLWMPVMWNHVTLQPHTDRMMKWHLRGWRWKKRRRGIRGGVSAYWPQCKRIIKVDWPGRSSHLVSFPSSLHLPFHVLLSLVHSQWLYISSRLLRVSSGGPIRYLQGIIVGSATGDDGEKMGVIATDRSTSPDGLWRLLSISAAQTTSLFSSLARGHKQTQLLWPLQQHLWRINQNG